MKHRSFLPALAVALQVLPVAVAHADNTEIMLDPAYGEGRHYTTVNRGAVREEIYTSPEAVAAARAGEPFPEGTQITMEMFDGGDLVRIFVMEKRADWEGTSQAGSWHFRGFDASGAPDLQDDGSRCQACHAPQADNDYVFSRDAM